MKTAVLVPACTLGDLTREGVDPLPHRVQCLRATLDALWSESPGHPADIIVHADATLAAVARKEHPNRVRVLEGRADASWGRALNTLVDSLRHRCFVFIAPGARPAPGWLRELVQIAAVEGVLVGPCLPLGAVDGPQACAVAPRPTRSQLRQAATRLRFLQPRHEAIDILAPTCIAVPRQILDRVGGFDGRYQSLDGTLLDLERRVQASDGRLLLARRALVAASPSDPLPIPDREALRGREEFFAARAPDCPPVALELEADDPAGEILRELADGLLERGIPLRTFSCRTFLSDRPSLATHLQTPVAETATYGAALALSRSETKVPVPARRLEFASRGEAAGSLKDCLRLMIDEEVSDAERLDAWALEVFAAARDAAGEPSR